MERSNPDSVRQNIHRARVYRNARGGRCSYSYRNPNLNASSNRFASNFYLTDIQQGTLENNEQSNFQRSAINIEHSSRKNHKQYRNKTNQRNHPNYLNYNTHENFSWNCHDQNSHLAVVSNQIENNNEVDYTQRGRIIGGRYIRKHAHQSSNSDYSFESGLNCIAQHAPTRKYFPNNSFGDNCTKSVSVAAVQKHFKQENRIIESSNNIPKQVQYINPIYNKRCDQNTEVIPSSGTVSGVCKSRVKGQENNASQRELLMQQLEKGDYECLVCCERIRTREQIWHCLSCYHVFHLRCIRKWARSPAAIVEDKEWRCPACQNLTYIVPFDYYCFCGKQKNPDVNYHLTPHSCGDICGRKHADCYHLCKELCHPGPCPPCLIVIQKTCSCGKTSKTTTCNQLKEETCKSVCEKILNCGVHFCSDICHPGSCSPCDVIVSQSCYCGKSKRLIPCTSESALVSHYSCEDTCGKELECGNHLCGSICHPGACETCSLSPEVVKTCCCGKTSISELIHSGKTKERKSCLDSIPICDEVCRKILHCGPKDNLHTCQSLCHEGACPSCALSTSVKCRCGAFTKEISCAEMSPSYLFLCEKRCSRRKDCGRHKCLNNCCINSEHKCELVCNKKLSCGLHLCPETCHMGKCPTCWNVSFDELRCHCGASVLYPPIHCGTKPPECSKPCARTHPCGHDVKHSCHSEEKCPPCTALTVKWCFGGHKQCSSVMCFLDGVSCGMPCLKPLPCGFHKCQLTCHPAPCLKDDAKCTQPCVIPRPSCGHPCGTPCHDGPCPETPCKAQVTLTCPCGHRSETTSCYDSNKSYHLMSVSVLASKIQEIKEGQSVNLTEVLGKKSKNNRLQCSEECAVLERNKRLAVALQIQNPDLSCSPGPPTYSEFLKDETKKNPRFVSDVYEKITSLVQLAKESKQKCRSYSFPSMNRDQRRVVQELAEFFGCETQSYDEEPKKNVVVTAYKSKCWLPFVSVMAVVQRDMGIRKGPAPVLAQRELKQLSSSSAAATNSKKKIDYFDFTD